MKKEIKQKMNIYKKFNHMKRYLLIFAMLLGAVSSWGQNISTDFVVIDNGCDNAVQLKSQYNGQANAYVVTLTHVMAPTQITTALNGKHLTNMHIFVNSKPGTLAFGNIALNPDNIQQYATALSQWASHISGNVIIHSTDVFTSDIGLTFKTKLQQLTGLTFIMQ